MGTQKEKQSSVLAFFLIAAFVIIILVLSVNLFSSTGNVSAPLSYFTLNDLFNLLKPKSAAPTSAPVAAQASGSGSGVVCPPPGSGLPPQIVSISALHPDQSEPGPGNGVFVLSRKGNDAQIACPLAVKVYIQGSAIFTQYIKDPKGDYAEANGDYYGKDYGLSGASIAMEAGTGDCQIISTSLLINGKNISLSIGKCYIITIPADQSGVNIKMSVLNDKVKESQENAVITLRASTSTPTAYVAGYSSQAEITITDDD